MTEKNKQDALDQIVSLARDYNISNDEITAHLILNGSKDARGSGQLYKTIFSYLGGIFIFAGLSTLVGMLWGDLGSASRVIVSFGPGLIAFILGVASVKDERYIRASTPLFLIAALLQPTGLFVFLNEFFSGDDTYLAAMIVFGPMAMQMGLCFLALKRASLLFFSIIFATTFLGAAFEKVGVDDELTGVVIGLSGLLVSYAVNQTAYRGFVPLTYFVYAIILSIALFDSLESAFPLDFLLIGVAALMIYASILAQSRSLLVAGVISMLGYLGYYTGEYFANVTGWPIALIIMGLVMIGLSSYAVKLSRRISPQ